MSIDISKIPKLLDASFMLKECPAEVPHGQRLDAERFIEAGGPGLGLACKRGAEDFADEGRYYTAAILLREHYRLER